MYLENSVCGVKQISEVLVRASSYSKPGKSCVLFLSTVLTTTALLTLWAVAESSPDRGHTNNSSPAKNLKIDFDKAVNVRLPAITRDLNQRTSALPMERTAG